MASGRNNVIAAMVCVAGLLSPLGAQAEESQEKQAAIESKKGYEAARRGYWQEANVRFGNAHRLNPGDPEILNNLAVSFEAIGRFDEAEASYEKALELAPKERGIKKNFRLFNDFSQTFFAKPEPEDAAAENGGAVADKDNQNMSGDGEDGESDDE